MNSRSFTLKPFPETETPPDLKITGSAGRSSNRFSIGYELCGPMYELALPSPAETPARKIGLWEKTCLEFFLAAGNSSRYLEFNLSPSGDWNVFRFESYRKGMKEEPAFASLPFSVRRAPDSIGLSLELGLDKIISADEALEVAVSAVIELANGALTYWALAHPGPRPDFHRKEGFIIRL